MPGTYAATDTVSMAPAIPARTSRVAGREGDNLYTTIPSLALDPKSAS
jgi:hypothetical protein